MTPLCIELTITLETALSVGAGGSAGTLADKSIARDGWNRPIIPGSQVKGKVRYAAEQILRGLGQHIPTPFDEPALVERANPIRTLFGSPQMRSSLHFHDLPGVILQIETPREHREHTDIGSSQKRTKAQQVETLRGHREQHQSQIRPSVAINRRRGIAEDARLLFQETTQEGIQFFAERAITGTVPDSLHAALVWAALKLTTRWGGAKSRGLGWATVDTKVIVGDQVLTEADLQQAVRDLLQSMRSG